MSKPKGPNTPPRMSPTMQAVFDRVAREDAHLGDAMKLPWQQSQANFHVTASRWYKGDTKKSMIERFTVPCPEHEMPALRVSQIKGGRPGTLLFLHGGGWVFGSCESHLGAAALLSELTGLTVISVDYRLAPEHPFHMGLSRVFFFVPKVFVVPFRSSARATNSRTSSKRH